MPLLVLARHAFTPPAAPGGSDFERPLDATGLEQARRMGRFLAGFCAETEASIDTVIASAARRTVQTAEAAAAGLGLPADAVRRDRALYASEAGDWEEAIASVPAEASGALIVGHQPILAEVVAMAAGTSALPALPPSSIAVFRPDSWEQLMPFGAPELIRDFR